MWLDQINIIGLVISKVEDKVDPFHPLAKQKQKEQQKQKKPVRFGRKSGPPGEDFQPPLPPPEGVGEISLRGRKPWRSRP